MAKKALTMLKTNKSVKTRAEQYVERIASSLNIKILLPLKEKIEAMEKDMKRILSSYAF